MKKLTKEKFIEKAREVHGDKYDYSKVNYVNAQIKVCIICPEHGEFWQKPYNHISGNGCPQCVRNVWTTQKFIEKAREVHGDKYDYSKTVFKDVRTKVIIISHEKDRYGNEIGEFEQLPLSHLNGEGTKRHKRGKDKEKWETRTCPICGAEFEVRKKQEKITCSEECRRKYVELHKDEINEKRSKSLKETNSQKSYEEKQEEINRGKETCLQKYGVDSFSKTEVARKFLSEKMKRQKKEWDEKYFNDVLIPKYKEICERDNLELLEFRGRFDCRVRCKKCGNEFVTRTLGYLTDKTITNRCRVCHPIESFTGPTNFENEFEDFLKELGVKYDKNCRYLITPNEIDFYLPDYKVGFELDGIYWHSEVYKEDKYHLSKTERCREKGIQLIHIFEDEWGDKQEICKSRIKSILGLSENIVYARQCEVKYVEAKEAKNFLDKNHLQGRCVFKYAIGLFFNGELISLMTFGRLRKNLGNKHREGYYELIRFCNKVHYNVVGGASRLLKHFIEEYRPISIISYADRRWSNGNMYEKIGFKHLYNTSPNYFYVIEGKRINRFALRKNILVEKYNCPKDTTEKEFCLSKKWYRIYDCGNMVYEMKI